MKTEYRSLGISCAHCGEELAARRCFDDSVSIAGLHKLEYVHADTGERVCYVKREAQPFDAWKASAAFDAAAPQQEEDDG